MRAWDYPSRERGAADHDLPYHFGRHPLDYLHTRDYARLLVLRSRLDDREMLRQRGGDLNQGVSDAI